MRDRIDREYARPLDVEALARDARMSADHLSQEFRRAYGESPHSYVLIRRSERASAFEMARSIQNREARTSEPGLA